MSVAEVFDDAQVKAQDMTLDVPHPGHGTVRMVGFPVKMSVTPCQLTRPAPRVGEHTADVLAEQGLDASEIERLRLAKVIA